MSDCNILQLFRIVKTKWLDSAFDGEGAKRYGGRWNSKGNACIYSASSESLAILEMLVHLQDDSMLDSYSLIRLQVAEHRVMKPLAIPTNWQEEPAPPQTASLGDQWLASKASLALCVPSVIVPRESNYLINPQHVDMKELLATAEQLPRWRSEKSD